MNIDDIDNINRFTARLRGGIDSDEMAKELRRRLDELRAHELTELNKKKQDEYEKERLNHMSYIAGVLDGAVADYMAAQDIAARFDAMDRAYRCVADFISEFGI